jgi:hypothetical protein
MIDIEELGVDGIKKRMEDEGDCRDGDYYDTYQCNDDDELGFYQTACDYLLHVIESLRKQVVR